MPEPEAYFGLPQEVRFCRRCVMSNQRPSSYPEFKHTADRITPTLHIDDEGVCDACRYGDRKADIDWTAREQELERLLDKHRRNDGHYDCLVPGSGGKDSIYAACLLKDRYGMHPLTVTWPPLLYTDYGLRNFNRWVEKGGFDNISFKPNGEVQRVLTRLGIENLLHPFQTFILGQKNLAPRLALKFGIPLVFYGEAEAEYGNPIAETETSLRGHHYYAESDPSKLFVAGLSLTELEERHGIGRTDLTPYLPVDPQELEAGKLEVHYLGYYKKWTPQEAYYASVERVGFEARPFRSEGTYSKYNSIDDKIDDLHYYTTLIKFGLGRASYDAAQEIRNKHLTREEAIALIKRFEVEFPIRYFDEVMSHLELDPERFHELCDEHRSPHLWRREGDEWVLRHPIWEADGC